MADANGDPNPATRKVLDGCGKQPNKNNVIVLRLDNRIVGPPTPGSVHVEHHRARLRHHVGQARRQHGARRATRRSSTPDTPLEIDFFVTDPDGHLDHYELNVKYDLGSIKNLLNPAETGPFSADRRHGGRLTGTELLERGSAQTSVRPTWTGGSMRLHINHASKVFPKTCCYLVELTVWKRNIVDCDGDLNYYNQMHYSFTVTV